MTDPVHVEHADNVETADKVETVSSVDTLTVLTPPLTSEERAAKVLRAITGALLSFTLAIAVGLCVYFIRSKSTADTEAAKSRNTLTEQVEALTKQLTQSRSVVDDALLIKQRRDACIAAYGREITLASAVNAHALNQLIAAATDPTATPDERRAAYVTRLAEMNTADAAYQSAIVARDDYVTGIQVLPCPIDAN